MSKRYHPWARYRRAAGLTQSSVSDRLGVTRHMVIRLEQSLFWHPPDNLLVRLAELYKIELGIFESSYYEWVREQRDLFKATHQPFELYLTDYKSRSHPLVYYRVAYDLSRMGFCKALCLHYDPISEYELNKQRTIPEQLVEAAEEMGWDWSVIERAVADWRTSGNADKLSA